MYKIKISDLIIDINNLAKNVKQGGKTRREIIVMPKRSRDELLNLKEPDSPIVFKKIVFEWSDEARQWLMIVN